MKELSIEQKAKAYDRALEIAKAWCKLDNNDLSNNDLKILFPELKKSEDEKVINCIGMCLTDVGEQRFKDYNTTLKDCLEWLENQSKSDKIVEKAKTEKQRVLITESNGDAYIDWDTRSFDDTKQLLEHGLNYIKKYENTSKQKPAEKTTFEIGDIIRRKDGDGLEWTILNIENDRYYTIANADYDKVTILDDNWELVRKKSKFNEGDWIVTDGITYRIEDVLEDGYNNSKQGFISKEREDNMRLWTINDAKPGDILIEDEYIVMFKNIDMDNPGIYFWTSYSLNRVTDKFYKDDMSRYNYSNFKPATEEQSHILLNRIEKEKCGDTGDCECNIKSWNEKDNGIWKELTSFFNDDKPFMTHSWEEYANWIKSIKRRINS